MMANRYNRIVSDGTEMVSRHYRNWFTDMPNALLEFDPVKSSMTINQWIDKIEEHVILYEWDDVTVQHFILTNLFGMAKLWRDSLPRAE